jgi:hypothetical protein
MGNVYTGGYFTNSSGNFYVAQWNGSSWNELGGLNSLAANSPILIVSTDLTGNVYAGGYFTNAAAKRYVAKYSITSGIESLTYNNAIQISPNPCNNLVMIKSEHNMNAVITLYDLCGRVLLRDNLNGIKTKQVDVSPFVAGIYFLEVKTDAGKTQKMKIVKE